MTKRRADNALPPEIPHKRCLRSSSSVGDKAVGGETVVKKGDPPPLSSNVGQRCRKRPNYNEDEDSFDTHNLQRKVSTNRVNTVLRNENTCKSRRFEDAGEPGALGVESNKQPKKETTLNPGDKVMHTDEDLSAFNTFQFWRVPLPELDLSLLETESSAGPTADLSTKDLEAMET